jgi:hypothetical protein
VGQPRQIRRLVKLIIIEALIVVPSAWYFWL